MKNQKLITTIIVALIAGIAGSITLDGVKRYLNYRESIALRPGQVWVQEWTAASGNVYRETNTVEAYFDSIGRVHFTYGEHFKAVEESVFRDHAHKISETPLVEVPKTTITMNLVPGNYEDYEVMRIPMPTVTNYITNIQSPYTLELTTNQWWKNNIQFTNLDANHPQ